MLSHAAAEEKLVSSKISHAEVKWLLWSSSVTHNASKLSGVRKAQVQNIWLRTREELIISGVWELWRLRKPRRVAVGPGEGVWCHSTAVRPLQRKGLGLLRWQGHSRGSYDSYVTWNNGITRELTIVMLALLPVLIALPVLGPTCLCLLAQCWLLIWMF